MSVGLALADSAARAPFKGLPAGTEFSYRGAAFEALSELLAVRTLGLAASEQGDAAAASLITSIQVRRSLHVPSLDWSNREVAAVLSLSKPSISALKQLQAMMESEEQFSQSIDELLLERAKYIDLVWAIYRGRSLPSESLRYGVPGNSFVDVVWRPWFLHRATGVLTTWADLVHSAKTTWPATGPVKNVLASAGHGNPTESGLDEIVSSAVAIRAYRRALNPERLILQRCSIVALAVERFSREHGAIPEDLSVLVPAYLDVVPVDPYSRRSLVFRTTSSDYEIYSVGPNHQDDRGEMTVLGGDWNEREVRGDVGLKVRIRP
jgi:hypothetical protein